MSNMARLWRSYRRCHDNLLWSKRNNLKRVKTMGHFALIVIDYINDIVDEKGKLASASNYIAENHTFDHVNRAIAIARQYQLIIIHVKVGFSHHYNECPIFSPLFSIVKQRAALQLGTWGTEFHQAIDVRAEDNIVIKHRVGAYHHTLLPTILGANSIDSVFLAGVSTNMAIETTARDLHDADYNVVILEDACAASEKAVHDASINHLKYLATICNRKTMPTLLEK
jgi:nicotinamidase-related amidase